MTEWFLDDEMKATRSMKLSDCAVTCTYMSLDGLLMAVGT